MPIKAIAPILGVNADLSSTEIPSGFLTTGNNLRIRNGYAEPFLGQVEAYPLAGGLPLAPVSMFAQRLDDGLYWVVLGLNKAYAATFNTTTETVVWTDITRASGNYAATLDRRWNGGTLSGLLIVNDGVDVPQVWSPPAVGTKLTDLPNWPSTLRAKVMRPWRNTMVACNLTVGGVRRPYRIRISGPAAPGSVPASWDETSATANVYEQDVSGVGGEILDSLVLQNDHFLYRENATYKLSYIGGQNLYDLVPVFPSSGIMGTDCVVDVDGGHVVLTNNDLIIHNGVSFQSVLKDLDREELFKNMSPKYRASRCFVCKDASFDEVWVCYPSLLSEEADGYCDRALVYSYRAKTVTFRDLPNAVSAATGQVDNTINRRWDAQTNTWDQTDRAWNQVSVGTAQERLLLAAFSTSRLALMDEGTQYFGAGVMPYAERINEVLGDPTRVKTVTRLWPRVKGPTGTVLKFRVQGANTPNGGRMPNDYVLFILGEQQTVDTFASGKLLDWVCTSDSSASWRLEGLDVEFEDAGAF